jgi:hypothetical protein
MRSRLQIEKERTRRRQKKSHWEEFRADHQRIGWRKFGGVRLTCCGLDTSRQLNCRPMWQRGRSPNYRQQFQSRAPRLES